MFRNRTNSQKPNDELYTSFRASFPQLRTAPHSSDAIEHSSHSLSDPLNIAPHSHGQFGDAEDIKEHDQNARGTNEGWKFTPSMLDPNSFAFASFANQPPGYYTPTPGGINTLYHSQQAGDLHTPSLGIGLGTPLSLPTSEGGLHAAPHSTATMQHFHPQDIAPDVFQNPNPFAMQHQLHDFAPHAFTHDHSAFDTMDPTHDGSPLEDMRLDADLEESPTLNFATRSFGASATSSHAQQTLDQFRYHVTLNAPTAMIKTADEIPVTYLNKGQPYSLSIVDSTSGQLPAASTTYRTFIRVSFEDEQQRQRPASCWQLWKEGRGTNEAHQRGGRLQAVEFVDPTQGAGSDSSGRPKTELEFSSFDGFSVRWTSAPNSSAECSISVRFNFLSTDFSHSKGVKGIPVRLCAKTEVIEQHPGSSPPAAAAEVSYCKVKLFRDHGAERKLSNDTAHVKKTIDKLKQQIAQFESGMKDFGKRKRSVADSGAGGNSRPAKALKHKRTWSASSASSSGNKPTVEDDLQMKLKGLQDMFTSTRPTSLLYLRGDEQDDPDLFPVHLPGGAHGLSRIDTGDSTGWKRHSSNTGRNSSMVSPTPSALSLHSGGRRSSTFQLPTPFNPQSRMPSNEWHNMPQSATGDTPASMSQHMGHQADMPTKIRRTQSDTQNNSLEWIDAVGVDYTYQPPPERTITPVACFYILPRISGNAQQVRYYRAIYLMQRTLKDLVNAVALKCNVEQTRVVRTLRINKKGLEILLDDETVLEMPEGQDMVAELREVSSTTPMTRDWDDSAEVQVDGDIPIQNAQSVGYELRLRY